MNFKNLIKKLTATRQEISLWQFAMVTLAGVALAWATIAAIMHLMKTLFGSL
jgi:hypothetical protein